MVLAALCLGGLQAGGPRLLRTPALYLMALWLHRARKNPGRQPG
jgi:hypothetical protein